MPEIHCRKVACLHWTVTNIDKRHMCPHNLNWWVATKLMYILNIPGVHKRLEGPQTSTANSWMARDYAIRPWPFTHNIQLAHDEIRCHALWQRTRQRLCQQLTAVYECRKTWFPVWQPILRITKWVQSAWRTPSGTHVTWLDTTWSPDKEIDCTLWCPYDLSAHQSPKHLLHRTTTTAGLPYISSSSEEERTLWDSASCIACSKALACGQAWTCKGWCWTW